MGDKIEAKKIAKKYGLPVIEGSEGGISNLESGPYILVILVKEQAYKYLIDKF